MGIEIIIAFGGNMGDVHATFLSARKQLTNGGDMRIIESSCIYRSPPMGSAEQPDYLNAIALLDADIPPEALLQQLQNIEIQHGRIRTSERWGSRTLDLDLIAYNDAVMQTEDLTLPHPHMHERMFVLQPLCDIRPNWRHPALQQTAKELLASLIARGVSLLDEKQTW